MADGNEYELKALSEAELAKKIADDTFEGKLYKQIYDLINANRGLIEDAKPKVSKNSSGYYLWDVWDKNDFDLSKLVVGSQGTLGIITEVKFKLIHFW